MTPTGIPRLRWRIGGLLGAGVLINYFDRISLSVAGPQLQQTLGLSSTDLGLLFSAFFWTYAMSQIPAGLILDRWGVTRVGRWSACLWGVASAITAVSSGFVGLFAARTLLGIAEAPSFPANSKATGYWFPRAERASSTALFDAAAKFSNVVGVPLVALAVVYLGWRWGFALVAALSFAYFTAFYLVYRDPSGHPQLSAEEREYIRAGGAAPEGQISTSPTGMLGHLLGSRKVWGLSIGFAALGVRPNPNSVGARQKFSSEAMTGACERGVNGYTLKHAAQLVFPHPARSRSPLFCALTKAVVEQAFSMRQTPPGRILGYQRIA
jgi:sugar phosphate permease